MDVFAFGVGGAFFVVGGRELFGELHEHGASLFLADGGQDPADGQRLLAVAVDLHRDLVGGTTDAAAADLDVGLYVFDGGREDLDGVALRHLLFDDFERRIEDVL